MRYYNSFKKADENEVYCTEEYCNNREDIMIEEEDQKYKTTYFLFAALEILLLSICFVRLDMLQLM